MHRLCCLSPKRHQSALSHRDTRRALHCRWKNLPQWPGYPASERTWHQNYENQVVAADAGHQLPKYRFSMAYSLSPTSKKHIQLNAKAVPRPGGTALDFMEPRINGRAQTLMCGFGRDCMPLKICILEADDLHPQLQPDFHSFGAMFVRLLDNKAIAANFSIYNVVRGEYPCEREHFDAFLVTSSKADAFGSDAWIVELRNYLLLRYHAGDVLLGICFGHQVLALALGGHAERAKQGWGVGVHSYRMLIPGLAGRECPESLRMLISHRDQVTRLPDGAQLLASSDFCPNAAFML